MAGSRFPGAGIEMFGSGGMGDLEVWRMHMCRWRGGAGIKGLGASAWRCIERPQTPQPSPMREAVIDTISIVNDQTITTS